MDNSVRERIIKFLVERVQEHPDALLLAKPLVGEFKGLYRFRVGDYRLFCEAKNDSILIARVEHRRNAYD